MAILPETILFNRPKKYRPIEELGGGACGETVRVRDEEIEADFVVKKYSPVVSKEEHAELFATLFRRFRDEARILFRINHTNIVRVFNYFDYGEYDTAYIIMEYVEGLDIIEYLKNAPDKAEAVFERTIEGFAHLEKIGILHRDIRPANLLITTSGEPKIIDFGFGKDVGVEILKDEKSISLNWWCETPPEFDVSKYDVQTEVYFVGKLFELAIAEADLQDFRHSSIVRAMCRLDRDDRIASFSHVQRQLAGAKFEDIKFSQNEIDTYRSFSNSLASIFSSIENSARYRQDTQKILSQLEEIYKDTMLQEFLPDPNRLARAFVDGRYRYWKGVEVAVLTVKYFLDLLRGVSGEKKAIIIRNVFTRLDGLERFDASGGLDDEIPF